MDITIETLIQKIVIEGDRPDELTDYMIRVLPNNLDLQKSLFANLERNLSKWSRFEFNRITSFPNFFIFSQEEGSTAEEKFPLAYDFLVKIIFVFENYFYSDISKYITLLKALEPEKNVLLNLSARIDTDNPHHIKIGVASLGSGSGNGINLNKETNTLLADKYEKQLLEGIQRFQADTKLQRLVEVIILEPNRNIRDNFRLEVQDIVNLYKNKL